MPGAKTLQQTSHLAFTALNSGNTWGKESLVATMTDDVSAVKRGQLGSAGAAAGPLRTARGGGGTGPRVTMLQWELPGCCAARWTDGQTLPGAPSAALQEIPEHLK